MADSFKRIGIIGKYADTTVSETPRILCDYLQTRDVELLLDEATADFGPIMAWKPPAATSSAATAT